MTADAGLRAVARVRQVREQDSRVGLARAIAEERECVERLDQLDDALGAAGRLGVSSTSEFIALRQSCVALNARIGPLRAEATWRHAVTEETRVRWQQDKTRVRAVEMLLERRAEARRIERRRAEARDLDEIAIVGWSRRTRDRGEPS